MKTPDLKETGVEARRKFLKTIAATGGAAAVTMSLGVSAADGSDQSVPDVSKDKLGYHETQHIKDYYAKAF
jgi:hypothetical protein